MLGFLSSRRILTRSIARTQWRSTGMSPGLVAITRWCLHRLHLPFACRLWCWITPSLFFPCPKFICMWKLYQPASSACNSSHSPNSSCLVLILPSCSKQHHRFRSSVNLLFPPLVFLNSAKGSSSSSFLTRKVTICLSYLWMWKLIGCFCTHCKRMSWLCLSMGGFLMMCLFSCRSTRCGFSFSLFFLSTEREG